MAVSGSLRAGATSVEQGERITFDYATTPERLNPKNWIGVYEDPGVGPVDQHYVGASTLYNYAPDASGTSSFATGSLGPGAYLAFYLFNDGYTWLAPPVPFSVTASPAASPPVFRHAFGQSGRRLGQLSAPAGIAVDAQGLLWVADTGNNRVQAFAPDGRLARILFGRFTAPQSVAVDAAGIVYVADTGGNRVVAYRPFGLFLREYGAGTLVRPRGVAVDTAGRLHVADTGHQRIARFDVHTGAALPDFVTQVSSPEGMTSDGAGGVWAVQNGTADSGDVAVVHYAADGSVIGSIGAGQSTKLGGLSNPSHVATSAAGNAYVTVPDLGWVTWFRTTGAYRADFGFDGAGTLRSPLGVAVAGERIFVSDTGNDRIVEFGAS